MLFSEDRGALRDTTIVLAFIAEYFASFGITRVEIDADALYVAVREMHRQFPYPGGEDGASPFKKAANFICYFVASNPVATPLPPDVLRHAPADRIEGRTNAVIALLIAIESLHLATLTWEDGSTHTLTERIELSRHSFVDIVDALTAVSPVASFKLVSVLLEQMAYKSNSTCQYPIA